MTTRLLLAFACLCTLSHGAASTGALEGRVLHAATGEYLERARVSLDGTAFVAFTDDAGRFAFPAVPAGPVRLRVTFTGLAPETATVTVAAGTTTTRDFTLDRAGTPVQLAQFTVGAPRDMDGAAIAINDQRHAPDMRKVLAADEFGTTADGSVGELLKSVPGVSIAWVGGEAMNIQLNGVPADYTPVTLNGFEQASAQANTARNIQMTNVATNNLSRIEVRFSPTPESPGHALAGTVNLVVRSAFERSRPVFNLSAYTLLRDEARSLGRSPGPGPGRTHKVHPGFEFSYVRPVSERFGFTLSGGGSTQYQPSTFIQTGWRGAAVPTNGGTFPTTTPDRPYLTDLLVRDFPRLTKRKSAGATLDWRTSRHGRLSLSLQAASFSGDYSSRDLTYAITQVPAAGFGPTFTRGAARGANLTQTNADRDQDSRNLSVSLIHRYSGPVWKTEAGLGDSQARAVQSNYSRGYHGGVTVQRTGLTMAFEDIGPERPGRIAIADGTTGATVDPHAISSYNLISGSGNARHGRGFDDISRDGKRSAYAHAARDFSWPVPLTLKAGLDVRQNFRDRIGGTMVRTAVAGTNAAVVLDPVFSQRPGVFGFPATQRPGNRQLFDLFTANPALFTYNENNHYRSTVGLSKFAQETTSAAYLRGDVALFGNRLRLVGGLRAEQTNIEADGPLEDLTRNYQRDSAGRVLRAANGQPLLITTNALEASRRTYLERASHVEKEYLRLFPSLNASWNFTENLILRAAYFHTVGRPNYNQYAGGVTLPDLDAAPSPGNRITVSNTAIKVWNARSGKLALERYFEGVGVISIGAYRRQFENFFGSTVFAATPEFLEIHGVSFADYGRYEVATQFNLPATVHMSGVDFQYRQALTFLPAWARGLQVIASGAAQRITGVEADNFSGMIPRTASVGVVLTRPRFNVRLNWTYQSERKLAAITGGSVGPGTFTYATPRRLLDLNAEFNVTRRLALFANLRNLGDESEDFERRGPDTPAYAKFRQSDRYGGLWIFGVRGVW
ncbi:MAG: TonB-dependent receptor [Opitutaceae bacterium]|nr:TonB-dependent receptor [Opitutaceae bacterium]